MATVPLEELRRRAEAVATAVGPSDELALVDAHAMAGGGSAAGMSIPSVALTVPGDRRAELRRGDPPVVARTRRGETICDLRSVEPAQDAILAAALATLVGRG
jgi:L-seryl-tRNA(Ser) seleniumtransferase